MLRCLVMSVVVMTACTRGDTEDATYEFTETIRSTEPQTPEQERAGFKLPDGFEIELFASEPQISKPINIDFDARGRMWVTQSSAYPVPESGNRRDKITIIEDTDGDGRADRFIDFIDTLNIPIGVLPTDQGALAFSIPNIYAMHDSDGDDKADEVVPLIGRFGYIDTHGMVSNFIRGFDGWIYACHGFTNHSTFAGTNGDSVTLVSGNTFRFSKDGSVVEQTTFGQVNPFGLVFDELGYLYSTDSHTSPLYQLIRGGNYPHFGKEELMAFGPDMKSLDREATALCGIAQYADTQFPPEFRDNFFVGDAVKSVVHRYSWKFEGSSPVGKNEEDLIRSADPWFRPVNIKLGPDGALYVADFYNAIIGHYEVPLGHPKRDKHRGRIWRITYKGEHHKKMDLSAATLEELLIALKHDNLPVRMRATDQLVDRIGAEAIPQLNALLADPDTSPRVYVHTMWALHRLKQLSLEQLEKAVAHESPMVRLHALRVMREIHPRVEAYYSTALAALKDPDPHVCRAAVELLKDYPRFHALQSVLSVLPAVPTHDTHLQYTIRLTVKTLLESDSISRQVLAGSWSADAQKVMAEAMLEVNSPLAAEFLARFLENHSLNKKKTLIAYRHVARMLPRASLPDEIEIAFKKGEQSPELAIDIFRSIRNGLVQRSDEVDEDILRPHAVRVAERILKSYQTGAEINASHLMFATELAGTFMIRSLEGDLKALLTAGGPGKDDLKLRSACFRSLIRLSSDNLRLAEDILLDDAQPEKFRVEVARMMGEFPGEKTNTIFKKVNNAPPLLRDAIVISMAGTSEGKDIILRQIREGKIPARVLAESQVEERFLLNISSRQKQAYDELVAGLAPISAEREALIQERIGGFKAFNTSQVLIDSGKIIFNRYCNACHRRANQVGIGPQLHGIGKRGPEAIIEKILDPNRNISRAFQNYTIRLKDGKVLVGLYRREEGETLILADMAGKEFTVARRDIETMEASKYTLMPDNFGNTIPEKDFYSLVTYLLTW